MKDLYSRMEEPIQSNRWDCPLYQMYEGDEVPFNDLDISLFEGKKAKDPISTKPDLVFDSNYLFNLDAACQKIVQQILQQQDEAGPGADTLLKISDEESVFLTKKFTPVQLKKIKMEFVKISKSHPPKDEGETKRNFVEYLKVVQDRI